jgi:hypothetical protein
MKTKKKKGYPCYFNNDGIDDVVIGAYAADPPGKTDAGITYVVYGKNGGYSSPIDLSTLTSSDGSIIYGAVDNDRSGFTVNSVGDINNDDFVDLIIGAYQADPSGRTDAGITYVVYGVTISPSPSLSSSPTSSLSIGASPSNTPSPSPSSSLTPTSSLSFGASPSSTSSASIIPFVSTVSINLFFFKKGSSFNFSNQKNLPNLNFKEGNTFKIEKSRSKTKSK